MKKRLLLVPILLSNMSLLKADQSDPQQSALDLAQSLKIDVCSGIPADLCHQLFNMGDVKVRNATNIGGGVGDQTRITVWNRDPISILNRYLTSARRGLSDQTASQVLFQGLVQALEHTPEERPYLKKSIERGIRLSIVLQAHQPTGNEIQDDQNELFLSLYYAKIIDDFDRVDVIVNQSLAEYDRQVLISQINFLNFELAKLSLDDNNNERPQPIVSAVHYRLAAQLIITHLLQDIQEGLSQYRLGQTAGDLVELLSDLTAYNQGQRTEFRDDLMMMTHLYTQFENIKQQINNSQLK